MLLEQSWRRKDITSQYTYAQGGANTKQLIDFERVRFAHQYINGSADETCRHLALQFEMERYNLLRESFFVNLLAGFVERFRMVGNFVFSNR